MGKEIGKITHFFGKINVAAIQLSGELKIGDKIHILGNSADFKQKINSMQIDKEKVEKAKAGEEIGIKVEQPVKGNETVYLVEE